MDKIRNKDEGFGTRREWDRGAYAMMVAFLTLTSHISMADSLTRIETRCDHIEISYATCTLRSRIVLFRNSAHKKFWWNNHWVLAWSRDRISEKKPYVENESQIRSIKRRYQLNPMRHRRTTRYASILGSSVHARTSQSLSGENRKATEVADEACCMLSVCF